LTRISSLLILLIPGLLLSSGCKSGIEPTARGAANSSESRSVKTVLAQEIPMERVVAVTGTLAAYDQATVGAKVPGRVQHIEVDLGTVVKQGQLIAQRDAQDYQLQFKQADAALAQARARIGLTLEGSDEKINVENTGTVRQARAVLDEAKLKYERAQALF